MKLDPNATMGFELLSGGVTWSDEYSTDNDQILFRNIEKYKLIIAYRMFIVTGNIDYIVESVREECKSEWDKVLKYAPNWPGINKDRIDKSMKSVYENQRHMGMGGVPYDPNIKCPKCNSTLRTVKAKQCFKCGHDWHS